ncbi:MAG: GH39 family glycosyl hydrolase [Acidimicrobiales bacterium]
MTKLRRWVPLALVPAVAVSMLVPVRAQAAGFGGTGSEVTVSVDTARAGTSVNEALVGTNQPVGGAGPVMAPLGVHWGRADLSLDATYSCTTGVWDPSLADQRVQEDLAMGAEPEMIVDYSPTCLTSNPLHETLDPPDADGYRPWKNLVEQAAYHEMTTYGVHVFEVWNEPDGTFWHGSLADYLATYKATAQAIQAAAARAGRTDVRIGGPALVFSDPAWLEPFLAYVAANDLPLGFVSWHYYGNYPALGPFATGAGVVPPEVPGVGPYWYNPATLAQTFEVQVAQVKAEIAKYPQLHPLTAIDEWNIDAGYDPRSDGPYDAAFVAAVLDASQSAGVDRMAFFRVADDSPTTLGNWGILRSALTPKPVYWAFSFWHQLAGSLLPVTESPDQWGADHAGRIGSVASVGPSGVKNLLIYDYAPFDPTGNYGSTDPNPYDHPVTVEFAALAPGRWHYTVRLVDATHHATLVARGSLAGHKDRVHLLLPGESVALVQVTPA